MARISPRKRKKELKLKREFRSFIREVDRNISELTRDTTNLVKLAAESKAQGLSEQYKKAINGIKFNMNTRLKYISLKMDLKMAIQMRDSLQIVRGFADAMTKWGKSINKISNDFNIDQAIEKVSIANELIEEKNEEIAELTNEINNGFTSVVDNNPVNIVSIDEAEKLVEGYIACGGSTPGQKEEVDIEKIRKMLDEEKK